MEKMKDARIRVVGMRQAFVKRCLSAVTGLVTVIAMGIAADYAIGPAWAASSEATAILDEAPLLAEEGFQAASPSNTAAKNDIPTSRAAASSDHALGPDPGKGFVRLPGHVLDAMAKATPVDASTAPSSDQASKRNALLRPLTLTLVLKRGDQFGFDQYLKDVYDPQSKNYQRFLSQSQITKRFGPSKRSYSETLAYLRGNGLKVVEGSKNRMTLTVRGTRAQVDKAFLIHVGDYKIGETDFYANDADPALPASLAAHVLSIDGLSSLSKPESVYQVVVNCNKANGAGTAAAKACIKKGYKAVNSVAGALYCYIFIIATVWLAGAANAVGGSGVQYASQLARAGGSGAAASGFYATTQGCLWPNAFANQWNTAGGYVSGSTSGSIKRQTPFAAGASSPAFADGTGQTVGLVEFDGFYQSDVSDYLATQGAASTEIDNLSVIPVNGGVSTPGSGEAEVLLDIDTVMSFAPGAKVAVYEAPFSGQASSYSAVFNAMINGGVTIISNSWASCEDQVSEASARGVDSVLQAAAAAGISVFNGTGDSGSSCLDGSANTVSMPADSPNATAVGGTMLPNGFGPSYTYNGEQWWDGTTESPSTGQGGFGVSKFFSRPTYQDAVNGGAMRSIPDVVAVADPYDGIEFCQADNGGCPNGQLSGGTSFSTPEWAAIAALLNQTQAKNIGFFNPVIYPLAASDAFHTAASMGSDFAHVGLGSPNLNVMARLLKGQTVGVPDAATSRVTPLAPIGTAQLSVVNGALSASLPADGSTQAGVVVTLYDANLNTVSGKTVTLTASSANAKISAASGPSTVANGAVTFTMTDLVAETVTLTATDTTDGVALTPVTLTFGVPRAASAGISANPPTVAADGSTAATIVVTLLDSLGRPTPGKAVTVSDAGAHAVISGPTPAVTDANGQIQFSATDQINEAVTFTAVDVTDENLPIPGSATVTYSGSTSTACGVGTVPVAGSGYTITAFITGIPAAANLFYGNANIGCPGAGTPVFTSSGAVLVTDFLNGNIYQTSLSGGAVSTNNILGTLTPALGPLVYGKDGSAYATLGDENGDVVQVDPTTGAQLRVVASGLTCPAGLAVDPLSGDLFFDDDCTGAGTDNASIFRVIDPANTNTSSPTSVVVYATLPATPNADLAFAPNGTLYAVSGYYYAPDAPLEQVSGTNSTTVTVTPVTGITSNYGVAIGAANSDGSAQSLVVNSSTGVLSLVPIANPSAATVIVSSDSPGPGVVGPDGCMYSAGHDTIYKIANSTGGCIFAAANPVPSILLTPATVSPNPAQGGTQTFTAALKNVTTLSGVRVDFQVTGANPQAQLADTDASGNATITYQAVQAGTDTVIATATAGSSPLISNTAQVTFTAGKDVAIMSLNSSPQGGTINAPVTVVASLSDISNPTASLAGQAVTFTEGSSSCTATTNIAGVANCSLTPSTVGSGTLTASFAGSSTLAAATESVHFNVSAGLTPAPTVSLSVSPGTIAAGSAATLTWSSTNATSCAASGSWSGSEATSGSQTVTPPTNGSYSYTLTCAGAGGSGAATALLAATLVAVNVTAKSGGGAMTWYALIALGLLVLLRFKGMGGVPGAAAMRARSRGHFIGVALFGMVVVCASSNLARADQSSAQPDASGSPYYAGIRVGSMPLRQDSTKIDEGLASLGFPDVTATSDISGAAGTVFVGYEFTAHTAVELGYTYRDSTTAHLTGTIPSADKLTLLLQDTTELTRGYGNIVSLSYAGRFEVLPRFSLEPRLGGFFWATKAVAITLDDRIDTTHEGGGVTAGLTAAYRVWHGLEVGVSVDHYRGFPNNIATLYAGTLEWRFGR